MQYLSIINLFFFISMVVSLKLTVPKFCVNCKYYIPSESTHSTSSAYGKCLLFNITTIKLDETYLVTGVDNSEVSVEYNYCSTARKFEGMCGADGKRYEQK
jgi:nanoRNase/pAp phosphatase (c-di-AMP/oligoRNAs hydrolase)